MCVVIHTFPPPFEPAWEIESAGQLRALAGKIVCFEHGGSLADETERGDHDDCCLCHVDIETTLEDTPWSVERTVDFDWQLVQRASPPPAPTSE